MGDQKNCPFEILAAKGSIALKGKITSFVAAPLMDAFVLSGAERTIVLDFSDMEHIDIFGINELIKLFLHAKARSGNIVARGLSPYFQNVFAATRISDAIPIELSGDTRVSSAAAKKDSPWAKPVASLKVPDKRQAVMNLNVEGRSVVGPVQGFGQLWEKIYRVRLTGISITPKDVIEVLKENFPSFQPPQNRFYPSDAGIVAGEVVVINATSPAGPISTGVWVVYCDDESFTFMTPQGHPESGWVSFTAFEDQGCTVAQVLGFARANDPLYELGFRIAGSKLQEKIWTHVLTSLAQYLGVSGLVDMKKTCVGHDLQWDQVPNIWYNAQIRTTFHFLKGLVGYKEGAGR
jgi:anti-anti-sigma regulatory factor